MIPVRLYLQNFMAYKAGATLDFADIHLACLSGENGAGKSSLLDAITWALWGKARASQSDDLVHLGESEMEVEFAFSLGEEVYRVLRRRVTSGRGKSELHFHISDAGGWRTLTEGSIRNTQQKIDRLLRLDYDTFINSAFLLQGRADEFTNKTARERKEILADILGLGIYDEYADRARDQARHYQQEIKIIEGQIEQIDQELAREAEYQTELQNSREQAAQLKRQLDQTEQQLTDLRQQSQALVHQRDQLDDLQERLAQTRRDAADVAKAIAVSQKKIEQYQAMLNQADQIKADYEAYQQAQVTLTDWNQRLAKLNPLLADKHQLQTAINQAKTKLEANIHHAEARLAELATKSEAIPRLEVEQTDLAAELATLHTLEQKRDDLRTQLEGLKTEAASLDTQNKQLNDEMKTIKLRLTQLEAATALCPVCEQPLSDQHRQQVQDSFKQEGKLRGDTYRVNRQREQAIEQELKTVDTTLKATDKALKTLATLQTKHATITQRLTEAQQAQETAQTLHQQLTEWQTQLTDRAYETEAARQLKTIEAELAQLGYDRAAHQAVEADVDRLKKRAETFQQLSQAQTRLDDEQPRLQQDQERQTRLQKQITEDQARVDDLTEKTKGLAEITAALSKASNLLNQLQREERLARSAVGAAEQKLNHVAQQAKEKGKKEEKLIELNEARGIYQELRTAFGKNGVQALLIENTIPELEDEANAILSQMTDGRMNLQFLTQRETKTGQNLIETLDIRIADEIGTRDYELYSGGEAFRVNFAIRIALSKLLARRSGAKLQTLVIDEGFGTQDAQGRERLVEAINKIQQAFEKIIIITHIDELKDSFPTRILVQKTLNGSTISTN